MAEYIASHPAVALAGIIFLGVFAQVFAQRLRLPSILVLLFFGFSVSPAGFGFFNPDLFFKDKDLFFALISTAVAVILFEGGLTLKFHELGKIAHPLTMLIAVGGLLTWAATTLIGYYTLGIPFKVALLIGSILIVTGPTVIGPLLRHVQPTGRVSAIVKWEGILNDPVGALIAVLVFEAIVPHSGHESGVTELVLSGVFMPILITVVVGTVLGVCGALLIAFAMREHWIPDYLHGISTLAVVIVVFVASNVIQHEAGLLTVTIMGIVLANQKRVSVKHIVEFKEHLGVLFISCLFIVLSARLTPEKLKMIDGYSLLFLAGLIFVVRPLSVFGSSWSTDLSWRENLFVAWMAPRGIVAAAVASLFAIQLEKAGIPGANKIEPVMFLVIIGTVATYGLTASPLARWLGIASKTREGLLLMGAQPWAREMARAVSALGIPVVLVDTNRRHILQAKMEGLNAFHGNILDEAFSEELDLAGIGRLMALTSNDEANALAALHCSEFFGRPAVYQIRLKSLGDNNSASVQGLHLQGRPLFREEATHSFITSKMASGSAIRTTHLTEEYNYEKFQADHENQAVPLFVYKDGKLNICTTDREIQAEVGQTIIFLADSRTVDSATHQETAKTVVQI